MLTLASQHTAPDGQPFRLATLHNAAGMCVHIMDWGATLLSVHVPLADGTLREVLLGCAQPADYLQQQAYLGASVGRYANRIAYARFQAGETEVTLLANQTPHQLHGGPEGFDKRRWTCTEQQHDTLCYSLVSPDGDQGFPGELQATVRYTLTEDNKLTIVYQATCDRLCPVNLTNHAYFNLDDTHQDVRQHRLFIAADTYLPVEEEGIPLQGLRHVEGTGFDFRQPKTLEKDFGRDVDQQKVRGYDHGFLLNSRDPLTDPAACLWSSDGRLAMTVFTTAPALQVYSGNYLDGVPSRDGSIYQAHSGLALESEFLPDSPNHPEWPQPSCWLSPGKMYSSLTAFQFISEPHDIHHTSTR